MEKVLLYFAIKYDGNWDKVYEALDKKEKIALEELQNIEDKITCQYLTILSSQYPAGLKTIYKPPFVIFYEGNIFSFYPSDSDGTIDQTTIRDNVLRFTIGAICGIAGFSIAGPAGAAAVGGACSVAGSLV